MTIDLWLSFTKIIEIRQLKACLDFFLLKIQAAIFFSQLKKLKAPIVLLQFCEIFKTNICVCM